MDNLICQVSSLDNRIRKNTFVFLKSLLSLLGQDLKAHYIAFVRKSFLNHRVMNLTGVYFSKLIFRSSLFLSASLNAQIAVNQQVEKQFDLQLFTNCLIEEMHLQFEGLKLDTSLHYILTAENIYKKNSDGTYKLGPDGKLIVLKDAQEVAGNPPCFVLRDKGKVNIRMDERMEARRIVSHYKYEILQNRRGWDVTQAGLRKMGIIRFDAIVINKNGIILYALVLDNNFDRESAIMDTVENKVFNTPKSH